MHNNGEYVCKLIYIYSLRKPILIPRYTFTHGVISGAG